MRSVSFSDKSGQSLNSSDSYRDNILIEFAKSVKSSTVKKFSFLKRAKSSCYQVNKHNVSSWYIGKTGSIGEDSLSFDGNSSSTSSTSSQHGKDAASLGSVMTTTTNSSISSSPTRTRSKKHVKTTPIFGRSYKTIQSEVRIEQLKSEIEALKPQTVKRLI